MRRLYHNYQGPPKVGGRSDIASVTPILCKQRCCRPESLATRRSDSHIGRGPSHRVSALHSLLPELRVCHQRSEAIRRPTRARESLLHATLTILANHGAQVHSCSVGVAVGFRANRATWRRWPSGTQTSCCRTFEFPRRTLGCTSNLATLSKNAIIIGCGCEIQDHEPMSVHKWSLSDFAANSAGRSTECSSQRLDKGQVPPWLMLYRQNAS